MLIQAELITSKNFCNRGKLIEKYSDSLMRSSNLSPKNTIFCVYLINISLSNKRKYMLNMMFDEIMENQGDPILEMVIKLA